MLGKLGTVESTREHLVRVKWDMGQSFAVYAANLDNLSEKHRQATAKAFAVSPELIGAASAVDPAEQIKNLREAADAADDEAKALIALAVFARGMADIFESVLGSGTK